MTIGEFDQQPFAAICLRVRGLQARECSPRACELSTKCTRLRAYASEFMALVVAECEQPGTSIAKVACAHGLSTNMIHTNYGDRDAVRASGRLRGEFVALHLASNLVPVPRVRGG